jgi:hypothetical protein
MVQSLLFSDKLQHCVMGVHGFRGSKFLLFLKVHVHSKSVTCPVTQFAEYYLKAFVLFTDILIEHNFPFEKDNDFIPWCSI